MRVLVYYVDFHADNHQGGSGKSFEFSHVVDVPEELLVSDVLMHINEKINQKCLYDNPFPTERKFAIQRMEIV